MRVHVFAGGALPGGHLGCGEGEGGNAKGEEEAVWWWEKREAKKKSVCEKKSNDEKREREREKKLSTSAFFFFFISLVLSLSQLVAAASVSPPLPHSNSFLRKALSFQTHLFSNLLQKEGSSAIFFSLFPSLSLSLALSMKIFVLKIVSCCCFSSFVLSCQPLFFNPMNNNVFFSLSRLFCGRK